MKQSIIELNISSTTKETLLSLGFTTISELENHNYFSLLELFPKCYTLDKVVIELNSLGYLLPPKNEISIYSISLSKRLFNILSRNQILYLSQLSKYSKEKILSFRNLGIKTMYELEEICKIYHIEIHSLQPIKKAFMQYRFSTRLYESFFENHIYSIDTFKQMSSYDLYLICEEDYMLTLDTYYILKEHNIILKKWSDLYIFEILPKQKARTLWLKYRISTLTQFHTYLATKSIFPQKISSTIINEIGEYEGKL